MLLKIFSDSEPNRLLMEAPPFRAGRVHETRMAPCHLIRKKVGVGGLEPPDAGFKDL